MPVLNPVVLRLSPVPSLTLPALTTGGPWSHLSLPSSIPYPDTNLRLHVESSVGPLSSPSSRRRLSRSSVPLAGCPSHPPGRRLRKRVNQERSKLGLHHNKDITKHRNLIPDQMRTIRPHDWLGISCEPF